MSYFQFRALCYQGYADRGFKRVELEPHAAFAQHFSVIGGDEDVGVFQLPNALQRFNQPADHFIKMRAHRKVSTPRIIKLLWCDIEFVLPDCQVISLRPSIPFLVRNVRDLWFGDINALIHVPIFLSRDKRVVGLGERHMQHEGAIVR